MQHGKVRYQCSWDPFFGMMNFINHYFAECLSHTLIVSVFTRFHFVSVKLQITAEFGRVPMFAACFVADRCGLLAIEA